MPSPPFTDDLRRQCRVRLLGCLADLTRLSNVTQTANGSQRVLGVTSNGEPWISRVLQTIRRLEQDFKHVELLSAFDSEDREVLERSYNIISKLNKACQRPMFSMSVPFMMSFTVQVSNDKSEDVEGVELLLQSSILQFHLENDADERDTTLLEVISSPNYPSPLLTIPTD